MTLYGKAMRIGVVSRNGNQEVVPGIVLQLYGQNTSQVIANLYEKIPHVQKSLPKGVNIVPYYDGSRATANYIITEIWNPKENSKKI